MDNSAIYTVSFTTFVDDYKLRGRDPSTTNTYLFSSMEKAEEYLRFLLCEELKERGYNDDDDDDNEKDILSMDLAMLEGIAEEYFTGEFVPQKVEWDIIETSLDTKMVPDGYFRPTKRAK